MKPLKGPALLVIRLIVKLMKSFLEPNWVKSNGIQKTLSEVILLI